MLYIFLLFWGNERRKNQIFRTPADTEGKVVLMWMTGAYQYWTNYSTAINYAFVWVRRKTQLLFSKKILSFFVSIVPNFYKTKRIKTCKDFKKNSHLTLSPFLLWFILSSTCRGQLSFFDITCYIKYFYDAVAYFHLSIEAKGQLISKGLIDIIVLTKKGFLP